MYITFGNETVTIVKADLEVSTRDNSQYRDWDNATTVDVPGCSVQPVVYSGLGISFESNAAREFSSGKVVVFAPAGTDVSSEDRAIWNGVTYEVSGNPEYWKNFEGQNEYVFFTLWLREG